MSTAHRLGGPLDGLLWCVEVVDTGGTGTIWPDFRVETPYRVVLPWDVGAE